MITYRKVGGLHFVTVGSVGASFYARRPDPARDWNTRTIMRDATVRFALVLGLVLAILP